VLIGSVVAARRQVRRDAVSGWCWQGKSSDANFFASFDPACGCRQQVKNKPTQIFFVSLCFLPCRLVPVKKNCETEFFGFAVLLPLPTSKRPIPPSPSRPFSAPFGLPGDNFHAQPANSP